MGAGNEGRRSGWARASLWLGSQGIARTSRALPAAATGVACIFGGEALCLLGPIAYERQVHLICHAILYSGVGLVAIAAALHWRSGLLEQRQK